MIKANAGKGIFPTLFCHEWHEWLRAWSQNGPNSLRFICQNPSPFVIDDSVQIWVLDAQQAHLMYATYVARTTRCIFIFELLFRKLPLARARYIWSHAVQNRSWIAAMMARTFFVSFCLFQGELFNCLNLKLSPLFWSILAMMLLLLSQICQFGTSDL